jgi:2-alkyl-3-oxoalkanoate reductase
MKVFVTGATGALGKRVIRVLTAENCSVVALSRSAQNNAFLANEKVEIREADLFNKESMIEATKSCDVVLHLATSIPKKNMPRLADWKMNDKIRTEGTRNLIEAVLANGIDVLLCESVTTVYGQQEGGFVSTDTPPSEHPFEMVKSVIEMEKQIMAKLPNRYVIFRFGNFYSENDFYTNNLISNVSSGKMPMIGRGDFYLNWLHLEDAASAIVFALQHLPKLQGKIVNVTDGHPVLFSEAIGQIAAATTNKKPFRLPALLAKLILGKNNFAFLTNSYRVQKEYWLDGWQPKHPDFITGITQIIKKVVPINNNWKNNKTDFR